MVRGSVAKAGLSRRVGVEPQYMYSAVFHGPLWSVVVRVAEALDMFVFVLVSVCEVGSFSDGE